MGFADLVSAFAADADPGIELVVARGRFSRAFYRDKSGALGDAMVAVDELLACHGEDPPARRVDLIVSGFRLQAKLLWKLGRKSDATAVFAATFDRYRDEQDVAARRGLARMLLDEATLAREDEQFELELQTLESIVTCFAGDDDSKLQDSVSLALFRRGKALRALDRSEEAVVVWRSLWERSRHDPDSGSSMFGLTALYNEALALGRLERVQEACGVLDELIARFVDDPSTEVATVVGGAVELRVGHIAKQLEAEAAVKECDRLLNQMAGATADPVRLAATAVMRLKMWELLASLRVDDAVAVATQLTHLFADEHDPSLVHQRGERLIEAARLLCYHPRFARARGKLGTRVALSVGDHLRPATRRRVRHALPEFLEPTAAVVEICRKCQDQAAVMFEAVLKRTRSSDDIESQELAARARYAWAELLNARMHPIQMIRRTSEMIEQGEAAARALQGVADQQGGRAWRSPLLSHTANLTLEPGDTAERTERLRAYIGRYGEDDSILAKVLVLEARLQLAYATLKNAVARNGSDIRSRDFRPTGKSDRPSGED